MRKEWEDVRRPICKYYAQGKSLEEVRRLILQETGFEASTRSYRLKLKVWKVKRKDLIPQLSLDRASQDLAPDQDLGGGSNITDIHVATDGWPNLPCLPESPSSRDANSGKAIACSDTARQATNEQVHPLIARSPELLHSCTFQEGFTSILHFAVTEAAMSGSTTSLVLEKVVQYIDKKRISMDLRDRYGRTALEIAIRMDHPHMVKILMSKGASVKTTTSRYYYPLHVAAMCGSRPEIHQWLIENGSNIYALPLEGPKRITPLQIVIQGLTLNDTNSDRVEKWFAILSCYIRPGDPFNVDFEQARRVLLIFLRQWSGCQTAAPKFFEAAANFLGALLRNGFDPISPLRWSSSRQCCRSLAQVAFFHSPDDSLSTLVGENSHDKFRENMALLCLSGCPSASRNGKRLCTTLEVLLQRQRSIYLPQKTMWHILTSAPEEDKVDFFKTLSGNCPPKEWMTTEQRMRPKIATALAAVKRCTRYNLIEVLMGEEWPWKLGPWPDIDDALKVLLLELRSQVQTPCSDGSQTDTLIKLFMRLATEYLYPEDSAIDLASVESFLGGLLHIVTKDALLATGSGSALRRPELLQGLLDLRTRFELPVVSIDPDVLLNALRSSSRASRY